MVERRRVGVLVPNLFVRVPVESAVRAAGGEPVGIASAQEALACGCRVIVVDLEAAGGSAETWVREATDRGAVVLAFGPHIDPERLGSARRAGAVAFPRGAFLARLPELLETAFGSAGETGRG